jgi:CBS domain-containing protein
MKILQDNDLSCLPVVENDRLVGLITEHDIMQIAAPLLKRFLES